MDISLLMKKKKDINSKNISEMPAKSRILFAEGGTKKLLSIEKTLKKYGGLSAADLVDLTHRDNTPWSKSFKGLGKLYSAMKLDTIKEYHHYEEV